MRPNVLPIIIVWLLLLCGGSALGQRSGKLADYSTKWLVFDKTTMDYVPFLPDVQGKQGVLHFRLDSGRFNGQELLIRLDSGTYVFENNNLKHLIAHDSVLRLSLDIDESTPGLLSIWRKGLLWAAAPRTWVVRKGWQPPIGFWEQFTALEAETAGKSAVFLPRPTWITEEVILLTWFLLLVVVGLKQGDALIFSTRAFVALLESFYKPVQEFQRLGTITALNFLLFYVLTLAYLLALQEGKGAELVSNFLTQFVFILAFVLIRLVSVLLLSGLYFGSAVFGWLHVREFIRLTIPLTTFVLPAGMLFTFGQAWILTGFPPETLRWLLAGLLVLRTLLLCYQIFRIQKNMNFYLFSYLCSTEILPAFFVMQYLLSF